MQNKNNDEISLKDSLPSEDMNVDNPDEHKFVPCYSIKCFFCGYEEKDENGYAGYDWVRLVIGNEQFPGCHDCKGSKMSEFNRKYQKELEDKMKYDRLKKGNISICSICGLNIRGANKNHSDYLLNIHEDSCRNKMAPKKSKCFFCMAHVSYKLANYGQFKICLDCYQKRVSMELKGNEPDKKIEADESEENDKEEA